MYSSRSLNPQVLEDKQYVSFEKLAVTDTGGGRGGGCGCRCQGGGGEMHVLQTREHSSTTVFRPYAWGVGIVLPYAA